MFFLLLSPITPARPYAVAVSHIRKLTILPHNLRYREFISCRLMFSKSILGVFSECTRGTGNDGGQTQLTPLGCNNTHVIRAIDRLGVGGYWKDLGDHRTDGLCDSSGVNHLSVCLERANIAVINHPGASRSTVVVEHVGVATSPKSSGPIIARSPAKSNALIWVQEQHRCLKKAVT